MTHFLICTNLVISVVHKQLLTQGGCEEGGRQEEKGEKVGQCLLKQTQTIKIPPHGHQCQERFQLNKSSWAKKP